jgi:hypothetical protein
MMMNHPTDHFPFPAMFPLQMLINQQHGNTPKRNMG